MEDTKNETQNKNDKSIKNSINEKVEYIEKNAGALTLIFSAIFVIGNTILRYVDYLMNIGSAIYFDLPINIIEISDENLIYSFFIKGTIFVGWALLNLIPYSLWMSEYSKKRKIFRTIAILFSPAIILLILMLIEIIRGVDFSFFGLLSLIGMGFLLGVMIFTYGIIFGISESKDKSLTNHRDEQKSKPEGIKVKITGEKIKNCMIAVLALLVLETILVVVLGFWVTADENKFKVFIVEHSSYVVVYETTEKYIAAECEIKENNVIFNNRAIKYEFDKNISCTTMILNRLKD